MLEKGQSSASLACNRTGAAIQLCYRQRPWPVAVEKLKKARSLLEGGIWHWYPPYYFPILPTGNGLAVAAIEHVAEDFALGCQQRRVGRQFYVANIRKDEDKISTVCEA